MSFETNVAKQCAQVLTLSVAMTMVRSLEARLRRGGLRGTQLLPDGQGRHIEFTFSTPPTENPHTPVIILENGLGAPLESWEWVEHYLADSFRVLRYHRRGYGRTTSKLASFELLELLLAELAPDARVLLCGHSLGGLICLNNLAESALLRGRTDKVVLADATDAHLLEQDRQSKDKRGRFIQDCVRKTVGSATGVNRWVPTLSERDVAYTPDIQNAFVTFETSPRTVWTAAREYLTVSTNVQFFPGKTSPEFSIHVLAAADNVDQQRALADRIGALFDVIPGSTHRSLIGKLTYASLLANYVRGSYEKSHN